MEQNVDTLRMLVPNLQEKKKEKKMRNNSNANEHCFNGKGGILSLMHKGGDEQVGFYKSNQYFRNPSADNRFRDPIINDIPLPKNNVILNNDKMSQNQNINTTLKKGQNANDELISKKRKTEYSKDLKKDLNPYELEKFFKKIKYKDTESPYYKENIKNRYEDNESSQINEERRNDYKTQKKIIK